MVIWLVVEPTHLKKYAQVKMGIIFFRVRGENKKCLKTPPSNILENSEVVVRIID